jgi:hypothetical protein
MTVLSETNDTLLAWVEVTPRHFELRADNEVVATLRWPKPFRSVALGDSPNGLFIFKQLSRFGLYVRVRDADSGADVATLGSSSLEKPNRLTLSTGESFCLQPLEAGLIIQDVNGQTVLTLRDDCYSSPCTVRVTRGPFWKSPPTVILLSMMALYALELQADEDIAATLAATTLLNVG